MDGIPPRPPHVELCAHVLALCLRAHLQPPCTEPVLATASGARQAAATAPTSAFAVHRTQREKARAAAPSSAYPRRAPSPRIYFGSNFTIGLSPTSM